MLMRLNKPQGKVISSAGRPLNLIEEASEEEEVEEEEPSEEDSIVVHTGSYFVCSVVKTKATLLDSANTQSRSKKS